MKAYDDVPYDTEANTEAHPSAIATLGRLAGLAPRMPSTARVLEIGCGNGENLIAAATYLPNARFVGFDLAGSAIAAGTRAAQASAIQNVALFEADIRDVRKQGIASVSAVSADAIALAPAGEEVEEARSFDYVIAHGMYSWVPEIIRDDLLSVMRDALAPGGLGFLSINALPGWELRRALRELALDRIGASGIEEPEAKVAETMRLIQELGRAGSSANGDKDDKNARGFFGALSMAAREYAAHVERATPPQSSFSHYVFHDLLADCNDAFSVDELAERLAKARLRIVCESPLRPARAHDSFEGLAADMAKTGTPFLQVIVQRDDEPTPVAIDPAAAIDLELWADLTPTPSSPDTYRTTTGAIVRPLGDEALERAVRSAPGFVVVRDLARDTDEDRQRVARQLFEGFCEGAFVLCAERPAGCAFVLPNPNDDNDNNNNINNNNNNVRPKVAPHVRVRAASACVAGASSAVLTNALHRSFRVPWSELAVIRLLDGECSIAEIARAAKGSASSVSSTLAGPLAGATDREAERFVSLVIHRFARHLFLRS